MSERLTLFGSGPYINESLVAIERAHILGTVDLLRKELTNEILKFPGPGMRKRIAGEIIRRFIAYDKKTRNIEVTPFLVFISSNFAKESKVDVLYYRFVHIHPIVKYTFNGLRNLGRNQFNKSDLANIVSNLIGRTIGKESINLSTILRSLRAFGFVIKPNKNTYQINEKHLAKVAFIFLLYQHFLSKGAVVPKTLEVRKFFNDFYNQSEEETTQMLLSYGDGFWVVERTAHLDQILLAYSNMDEFMRKSFEVYGGNS